MAAAEASTPPDGGTSARDTIARSFLALGTGEAAARVIAFLAIFLIARRLGAEALGVIAFSTAVLLYLSRVVDAGFDLAIGIREAALRRAELPAFIPPVLAFRLALAMVCIVVGGGIALAVLPAPEGPILALYCLTLIPVALSARWVLIGLDHSFAAGLARSIGELVVLMTVALVVDGASDIWRVPVAQLLGDTIAALIVILGLRRLAVGVRVRWQSAVIKPLLVRHIAPYVGSTLLGIVLFNADILFLRLFGDVTTVGLYASAYALLSFIINIGGTYALTMMPTLTHLAPAPRMRQEIFEQVAARMFLVVLPIAVGGGMIARPILATVFGAEFAAAGPVLAVLLMSAPFSLLRSVATIAIMAERREDALFRIVAISATANLVLNALVVPRWGMMGAAAVTVVTELFRLILSQFRAVQLGFAVPSLSRALKPMIAAAVMALLLLSPVARNPWLAIPAGAAVYGTVLMMLGALRLHRRGLPELRV